MVDSATLKVGCILFTLLWLAFGAVWCYLLVYLPVKGRKHSKGRRLAGEVQVEIASVLCLILLVYFLAPLMEPGDHSFRRFLYLMLGAMILEIGGFVYAGMKYSNPKVQRYRNITNYAYWFGGGAMFVSGASWIVGYGRPVVLELVMLSAAIGVLLASEMWFLRRNNWRFLPRHPE